MPQESRASALFYASFGLGDGPRDLPPPEMEIDVGPFAGRSSHALYGDPGSRRSAYDHPRDPQERPATKQAAAAAAGPRRYEDVEPPEGMVGAADREPPQREKVASNNQGVEVPTQPIIGENVGNLPPAPSGPKQIVSTSPTGGRKAPTPAKAIAMGFIERLQKSNKIDPTKQPQQAALRDANKTKDDKKDPCIPQGPNKDQVMLSKVKEAIDPNPAPTNATTANYPKIATALRAIGLPPSFIAPESVLYQAASEKVAAAGATADTGAYLARDDVHPMAIWSWLDAKYGSFQSETSWRDWDAEVVRDTLKADFGSEPSDATMNKIAALQLCAKQPDQPKTDWHTFEKVCLAFNSQAPRLVLIEDLSPEQIAMGVSVLRMLDQELHKNTPFSPELEKYCAARLKDSGLLLAPPELGFCDAELAKLAGEGWAGLRGSALALYTQALRGKEPSDLDQESPAAIQAGRLLRIHAYVLDRVDDLLHQG